MALTFFLILLLSLSNVSARRAHKRLIIHVPFRLKTHHHIHTVYSQIRSGSSSAGGSSHSSPASGGGGGGSKGGTKQTIYKIVSIAMQGDKGYAGYPAIIPHTGHGRGGGNTIHKSRQGGSRDGTGSGGDAMYEHELTAVGLRGSTAHEHGQGDIMYDDYHDGVGDGHHAGRCADEGGSLGYKDMVYNHFSRSSDESQESEEYPEVEEYVDEDEQGFVWE